MATIKKSDIINDLQVRLGFSKRECQEIADLFYAIIKRTLSEGEDVKLSGFGNFMIKDKKARKGRNPQTKESIILPARKVLKFKLSYVLNDEINRRDK